MKEPNFAFFFCAVCAIVIWLAFLHDNKIADPPPSAAHICASFGGAARLINDERNKSGRAVKYALCNDGTEVFVIERSHEKD